MLDDYIEKFAKLFYSPMLTPYNLLENLELDNYLSINYFKQDNSILADIVFLNNNKEITYRYVFDRDNFLQTIYCIDEEDMILQFDRHEDIEKLKNEVQTVTKFKKCI